MRVAHILREEAMKVIKAGLMAGAVLGLLSGAATAQEKTLAIVVKGLDNPFFEQVNLGCQKWNSENADSEYTCLYTGPASSADEAGQIQVVDDLLTRPDVAAIAISPSNAPLMARLLRERAPSIPVMTIDADLGADDASLRQTYLGTDNYLMGVKFAEYLQQLKPEGGTVCLQLGNVAADNINQRAAGTRDTLSGEEGIDRLAGQGGWTEVAGCPVFTNDQSDLANQQMADTFTANPDLTAFMLIGGWAQFAPQAYVQVTDQVMDKLNAKELVIVAGDTLPPQMEALKAGRSHVQVGQRPFEMGYRAPDVMIDLIEGRPVDPVIYTGLDECTQENAEDCIAG
jgi:ribose transport system substrate-binding protein